MDHTMRRDRPSPSLHKLYGMHSVKSAFESGRKITYLYITHNALNKLSQDFAEHIALIDEVNIVKASDIDKHLKSDTVHQGVLAFVEPYDYARAKVLDPCQHLCVIALDQVTDPHNIGAIFRTAAAYDVSAIVTTERHAPEANGTVSKVASGGLEHVLWVRESNLGNTLLDLQNKGYCLIGFDSADSIDFDDYHLPTMDTPIVLVFGAEDKGLRARTRDICNALCRLDMVGAIKSLNVSNAVAVGLEKLAQKRKLSKP